ncbi:MAG: hypothetical protein ABI851_13825 [Saprospiraceae bacterium]
MKTLLKICIIFIFFNSCIKNESAIPNRGKDNKLNERTEQTIVYDAYLYDGITYVLQFYSDDTTGIPLNSETEDSLKAAISDVPITLIYDDRYPNLTIIQNIMDAYNADTDSTTVLEPTGTALLATFFEDVN